MRYDPGMQAALGDAQGWALLGLVLAAWLLVTVLALFGALIVAARGRQPFDRR